MSGNIFGKLYQYISFGESHGGHIGCVIEGVPPNIELNIDKIKLDLSKRRPKSEFSTTRIEEDKLEIISGLFENKTTGAPITILVANNNINSKDYENLKDCFRPGHADWTYFKKYKNRDYKGGGRSSGRETIARVIAGSIAKQILPQEIKFISAVTQIGKMEINYENWDNNFINENNYFCPDKAILESWELLLKSIKEEGDSIGAKIETRIYNVPIGLGEPVIDKLEADIAKAIMSIGAVKAIEIGAGFKSVEQKGSEHIDQCQIVDGKEIFLSNNSGGIIGGISSGEPIIVRYAVKPTSSIKKETNSIDKFGNNISIQTSGRHDVCIGLRVPIIGESMIACVLADQYLQYLSRRL